MITLPGEVDAHRVRVGCDVVAIEDVQDSLAAFGDRYLRKVFTASEINDCQGRNRVHRYIRWFIDGTKWLDYSGPTCFPGDGDPYLQFGYYSFTGAGTNYSQFGGITRAAL
jgi:hypothetical protein